jgi:hypothetical protein
MNRHIEKLKGIAEAMGMTFLYESYSRLNLLLDKFKRVGGEVRMPNNVALPLCICVQPIAGAWAIHPLAGERRERQDCIVAFADAMPLDFTGEQADAISESLKGLATEFIDRLNASGEYEQLLNVTYEVGFDRFDACLCLVTIKFNLAPLVGECVEQRF